MKRKRFAFWIWGRQECQKNPLPKNTIQNHVQNCFIVKPIVTLKVGKFSEKTYMGIIIRSAKASPENFLYSLEEFIFVSLVRFPFEKAQKVLPSQ